MTTVEAVGEATLAAKPAATVWAKVQKVQRSVTLDITFLVRSEELAGDTIAALDARARSPDRIRIEVWCRDRQYLFRRNSAANGIADGVCCKESIGRELVVVQHLHRLVLWPKAIQPRHG